MSSFHAMWSFGAGAGAASGFVASAMDLSVVVHFALVSCAAGALLGPFTLVNWTSSKHAMREAAPFLALPRGPLALVALFALAAGLGEGAMVDWSAVFLRDVTGTTEARAALGYAAFSATMVAMRLCVDRLVTRQGPAWVARASGFAATSGVLLVAIPASYPLALLGFALMGVG